MEFDLHLYTSRYMDIKFHSLLERFTLEDSGDVPVAVSNPHSKGREFVVFHCSSYSKFPKIT